VYNELGYVLEKVAPMYIELKTKDTKLKLRIKLKFTYGPVGEYYADLIVERTMILEPQQLGIYCKRF
jgi:hypothetical protein